MPGTTLVSSTHSSSVSCSSIRSTRATPRQPSSSYTRDGELLRARGRLGRELGGADERRHADLVARLVVVEVLLARHGLDDGQRRGAGPAAGRLRRVAVEHRDRQVAPGDVALEQDRGVVGEGSDHRARQLGARAGELDAERRAAPGGLDDQREVQLALERRQRRRRAELLDRRSRCSARKAGVGMPASSIRCLASTLSVARMQAAGPDAV